MLCALQLDKSELSILLTDDDQIQRLNKLYRNIDRPTDVLSFSQRRGDFPNPPSLLLGDVVISVPTARRQATDRGLDVASEVNRLLAHGLLHLMGWDHDTPAKHQRMRRETERLCAEAATNTKGAGRAHVNRETDGATNGQSRRRTRKR
jgi:probable rRNA maturation factor